MNDNSLKSWVAESGVGKRLQSIVIDVTPILPGGENGGAKVFLLELIKKLALSSPKTQFTLLTKFTSHQELANLDATNIRRVLVIDETGPLDTKTIDANYPQLFRPTLLRRAIEVYNTSIDFFIRAFQVIARQFPDQFIGRRAINRLCRILNARFKVEPSISLLKSLDADLLLCPFTAMPYYEPGIPAVCIVYDLQHKTYPHFFDQHEVRHRDQIFDEACKQASKITAISNYSRKIAIFHGDLHEDKIRTNYLRMSGRVLRDQFTDEQEKDFLDQCQLVSKKFLIYPANFWAHKNHEMLITSFGMAHSMGLSDDLKLVCTGAPSMRRDFLMDLVNRLGLGNNIIFPGYVTDAQLGILMTNAIAMVFPSLYEGFGLPVIEAMANGIPVACSNVTSLPEVVGDAAITFNPKIPKQIANAILEMVNNPGMVISLIDLGKKRARFFENSAQMTQEYWELFDSALRSKS